MPVTVSLLRMVAAEGSRPFWPDDFAGLVAGIEADPTDHDRWLVLADCCQEHREPELEAALRYAARREEIELKDKGSGTYHYWALDGVKYSVTGQTTEAVDHSTAAGAFAELALQLIEARKDLE